VAEFALVVEEANDDFNSLQQLIDHAEVRAGDQFALSGPSRVAAANACVLYVASVFEEAVRQLGNAYVDLLATKTAIPDDRMHAIRAGLWERSASALTSKPYGVRDFDETDAIRNIAILKDFCIDVVDISLMQNNAVYNHRNMRAREINNVFKRLGIKEISNKIGRCVEFRSFFIVDTVAEAQDEFIAYLNDFYEVRNRATHELGVFRSQGTVDSRRYIEFFRTAVRRLSVVLEADLATFT
jgi:hypothetical protein